MKKALLYLLLIPFIFLVLGGPEAFITFWQSLFEGFKIAFPLFSYVAKMELEDYLTSPYFITGVIMTIASGFGFWFGYKNGKKLYSIVSIICALASLASIFMNVT